MEAAGMRMEDADAGSRSALSGEAASGDLPFVDIRNIMCELPGFTLGPLSFSACEGSVTAIIGPSGGGKSTLLKAIAGLVPLREGEVVCKRLDRRSAVTDGRSIAATQFRSSQIGLVFQDFHLWPHKSVIENITEAPRRVLGLSRLDAEAEAYELLSFLGLESRAHAYPASLSGGEAQRTAIARALAMHPSLLLLDEITSALDVETTAEVLSLLRGLSQRGQTMILVTHQLRFALDVATSLLFLSSGKIIEQGTPKAVLMCSKDIRVRQFLARVEGLNATSI